MSEFKKGKVARVAGPVIVARDMLGAQMYEVVRVGDQGLIGEIIRIEEDKATVQVYEETAGIRPGEAVERTGKPLSVELGPGITGQIYDGIQRPLTVLFEKTGPFIRRGIAPAPVDRAKKWHFVPSAKAGIKVIGGDAIGEVKETSLITQKILVPPNLSGQLSSVESEGEYTVSEPVAEMDTASGPVPLFMMHTWPVRIARPFARKLPSDTPLITGQRVMDFFFPIVKGGTAAIPGGFGTGKCVDPETPVLLADGRVKRIRQVVEGAKRSNVQTNGDETIFSLEEPLSVVSLSNPEFTQAEASNGYKGKTDQLVTIRTRSGHRVRVTPVHRLQRLNREDGSIAETPAGQLKPGDYLLSPRKIQLSLKSRRLDPYVLLPQTLRVPDPMALKTMTRILKRLSVSSDLKTLSRNLQVPYYSFMNYYLGRAAPTLRFLKRLSEFSGENVPVHMVKSQRHGAPIRVPEQTSPELAEFIGLILSDGTIRGRQSVILFNNDERVLQRFSLLCGLLFDTQTKRGTHSGGRLAVAHNSALVHLLVGLGVPPGRKSRTLGVPDVVCMSPNEVIGGFLAGYIAGDGSISEYTLEIGTASEEMVLGLSYLLARLGVLHRMRERSIKGRAHYRLTVEGRDALAELYKTIPKELPYPYISKVKKYIESHPKGYTSRDIVPLDPSILREAMKVMGESRRQLEKKGLWIHNYTANGEVPSVRSFKSFVSLLKRKTDHLQEKPQMVRNLERLHELCDFSFFDEVADVETANGHSEVYDITVPGHENFVGGWGPIICHNTVSQQQLSKWADAKVIVYVGCGERGNEMAEVLETFPKLTDPRSGEPLMNRTILVANTSNMPIAAREASVYTGITIAEYFRDMGYDVALMADSTSRWAEALREISGRLEEMPGEEGYPAYLASKLAEFYERAGRLDVQGSQSRIGSISVIGAVSPPGADFSEPVTQNTLRIVKVFWALDKDLASRRHFPAINWLTSYSLYLDNLDDWYGKVGKDWVDLRKEGMYLLQRDEELREIVMLVGPDALSEAQRVILEAAKMIKEDFLIQYAYHPVDSYCAPEKAYEMMKTIIKFYKRMQKSVEENIPLQKVLDLPVKSEISRMRIQPSASFQQFAVDLSKRMDHEFDNLVQTVRR